MWPSEPAGGGPAEIRRGPEAGPVGEGLGVARTGVGPKSGRQGSRRSRATAAATASRGAPGSGEDEAGGNGRSGLVVSVGARGGEGCVNFACDRPATGARRDGLSWRRRTARCAAWGGLRVVVRPTTPL
jgi:hypothetical protein